MHYVSGYFHSLLTDSHTKKKITCVLDTDAFTPSASKIRLSNWISIYLECFLGTFMLSSFNEDRRGQSLCAGY